MVVELPGRCVRHGGQGWGDLSHQPRGVQKAWAGEGLLFCFGGGGGALGFFRPWDVMGSLLGCGLRV